MGVGSEHGVEDDQQLAHASRDHDFERLSGFFEALGEGADHGIASFGSECGHVQNAPDGRTSAPDRALTLKATAVVVEGRQADKRADLLAIELPEFRQVSQKRGGGSRSDARGAAEDSGFTAPVVVGFQEGEDALLDRPDVLIEAIHHVLNALANLSRGASFKTIGFGRAQLDKLPSARDELFQFLLFFRRFGDSARPDVLAEAGNDGGVKAIGLGQDPQPASEVANLARIDDGHEVTVVDELGDQASLIPARSFDNDQARSRRRKLPVEFLQSALVVGQRESSAFREQTTVEGIPGDIDADERGKRPVHGKLPVLRMRARVGLRPTSALAAVRVDSTKPATITLPDGLCRPGMHRSVAGRRGAGCYATRRLRVSSLRSLPHGRVHLTN
jgi:hypothetical protein